MQGNAWWLAARRFLGEQGGSMPLIFVLLFGSLMMAAGGAIDFSQFTGVRAKLQEISDSSALAGATQLRLGGSGENAVREAAIAYARGALGSNEKSTAIAVDVNLDQRAVTVKLTTDVPTHFISIAGLHSLKAKANATARAAGTNVVCLLSMGSGASMLAVDNGHVTSPGCMTYSNSKSVDGLVATGNTTISSKLICSGGGYVGQPGNFDPGVTTDCPAAADPLASRTPPSAQRCDYTNLVVRAKKQTLPAGVYCGGLTITLLSDITFSDGVYVMKDGPFILSVNSKLTMRNATVYLTGKDATIDFDYSTVIDLSASTSGMMSGILFFEDRRAPLGRQHLIGSRNAPQLLGTIYLPRGKLVIGQTPTSGIAKYNCNNVVNCPLSCPPPVTSIGQKSDWTLVIANQVAINAGINLVLNSNYDGSAVPPPGEAMKNSTILTQ